MYTLKRKYGDNIERGAKNLIWRAVSLLIKELASFEKEANAVEVTVEDLERDGFGDQPLFKVFVAERE